MKKLFFQGARVLTSGDIQSRLSFVSDAKELSKECENNDEDVLILNLSPPVTHFDIFAFQNIDQIKSIGYKYTLSTIQEWKDSGVFDELVKGFKMSLTHLF